VAINSISSAVTSTDSANQSTTTGAAVGDTELPNQISFSFLSDESIGSTLDASDSSPSYRELTASLDTSALTGQQRSDVWRMNYNEAAIYLEEGFNNDKFDYHPNTRQSLPAYLVVHNRWFYSLDLLAALLLLSLAFIERPAVDGFKVNEGVNTSAI
jgi:hypothetical protein